MTFGAQAYGLARISKSDVAWSWARVAAFGAVEGFYGRTQYAGDWISYLNVSRAISALNWPAIFDPMWKPQAAGAMLKTAAGPASQLVRCAESPTTGYRFAASPWDWARGD
jgi:hypothetical protein